MQTNDARTPTTDPRRGGPWVGLVTALMWAVVLQAVTAGRIFSGDGWARDLHRAVGGLLYLVTVAAGITALIRLRTVPGGRPFGAALLVVGAALHVQFALGTAAAGGTDVLWLHLPLGVALVGLLAHALQLARRVTAAAATSA